MKLTEYFIVNKNITNGTKFALVSDLHGNDPTVAIDLLRGVRPDYILAPGDIWHPFSSCLRLALTSLCLSW